MIPASMKELLLQSKEQGKLKQQYLQMTDEEFLMYLEKTLGRYFKEDGVTSQKENGKV